MADCFELTKGGILEAAGRPTAMAQRYIELAVGSCFSMEGLSGTPGNSSRRPWSGST